MSLTPVAVALALIAGLAVADLAADLTDGVTLEHIAFEGAIVAVAAVAFARVVARLRADRRRLAEELDQARADVDALQSRAARWREESAAAARSFSDAVDLEFERWGLTVAEREVALLLLKGVSLKDIAAARDTAERTTRQQAAAVYAKAGVTGRTELASYFLDALSSPLDAPSSSA